MWPIPQLPYEEVRTTMIIDKAKVFAYRLFDVGQEVNLSLATQIFEQSGVLPAYRLRKRQRSLLIVEHPLVIALNAWHEVIGGVTYEVVPTAKLWSFGALSIQVALEVTHSHSLEELNILGNYLENDEPFHSRIMELAKSLLEILRPSIENPGLWEEHEDYLIFSIEKAQGIDPHALPESLLSSALVSLILTEKPMQFSRQVVESFNRHIYQYGVNDLVVIHWNGALVYDQEDGRDIVETIEYALCQLLELRYYDDLLDGQLKTLYQKVEQQKESIFFNPYKELSRRAALEYIDISEIVDRVGNAFKITGDYYYATIFKAATEKFHLQDWRRNVDHKLSNLAEVSKIFQGDINERRNQFMEVIIIVLIAIEVLPYVYSLVEKWF